MPNCWPVWMAEYICATFASRIRLRMAGVAIMISCAATRPAPSLVFSSVCEMTARSDSDNMARTISFSAAGKTSITRSMVLAADEVCSVPNTKWPVSAAVSARRMVPGRAVRRPGSRRVFAQRRAQGVVERQRVRADFALVDQALLRLVHEFDRVLDGEDVAVIVLVDVVDHRRQRRRLAGTGRAGNQHDAARYSEMSLKIFGQFSSSSVSTLDGMVRKTAPAPRCWLKALTRKRARLGISNEKSHSSVSS